MAFSKKTWKDRVSQYINRRLLTDSDGNTQQVTVTRDEGSVTEAGDAFSASNMNDLENRIDAAFDGLTADDIPYSAGVSVADKIADMTTYSTTEKAVGTWVDGSVLYEKTIEVDNPTSTVVSTYDYYQIYENNDNAKYVFVTSAFFSRANDNRCIALPYNRLYQANNLIDYEAFCDITTNKTTIAVFKPTALNISIGKVSITIRYTKSV